MSQWRGWEKHDLEEGNDLAAAPRWDALGKVWESGFGVTKDELKDAARMEIRCPISIINRNGVPQFESREEAVNWFRVVTVPTYVEMVRREVIEKGIILHDNEIIALAAFAHNVGQANLRTLVDGTLQNPDEIRLLQGDRDYLSDKMLEYNKAGGEFVQGLLNRRTWERDLFFLIG